MRVGGDERDKSDAGDIGRQGKMALDLAYMTFITCVTGFLRHQRIRLGILLYVSPNVAEGGGDVAANLVDRRKFVR